MSANMLGSGFVSSAVSPRTSRCSISRTPVNSIPMGLRQARWSRPTPVVISSPKGSSLLTAKAEEGERKRATYSNELSPEAQAELDAWKAAQDPANEEGFTLQNLDISKIDAVTVNAILFTIIGFNFFILPFVDFTGM